MNDLIIVTGLPGSGKSTYVSQNFCAETPRIDMRRFWADDTTWQDRMYNALLEISSLSAPTTVIEGVFGPESSLPGLVMTAQDMGLSVKVVVVDTPANICFAGIVDNYLKDGDVERAMARAGILYWKRREFERPESLPDCEISIVRRNKNDSR